MDHEEPRLADRAHLSRKRHERASFVNPVAIEGKAGAADDAVLSGHEIILTARQHVGKRRDSPRHQYQRGEPGDKLARGGDHWGAA